MKASDCVYFQFMSPNSHNINLCKPCIFFCMCAHYLPTVRLLSNPWKSPLVHTHRLCVTLLAGSLPAGSFRVLREVQIHSSSLLRACFLQTSRDSSWGSDFTELIIHNSLQYRCDDAELNV